MGQLDASIVTLTSRPFPLIPQALASTSGSALRVGLLLSALPAGFGVAALGGERLLPARLSNRQRGVAGALTCAFALVMLIFMPMSPGWIVPMLAMAGLGLGVFVPAALIAATIRPLGSAAGQAHEMGPSGAFG